MENTATIQEAHKEAHQQNWTDSGLELLVQIPQESLNEKLDFVKLTERTRLHVAVEGRRDHCFFCYNDQYIKIEYPKLKEMPWSLQATEEAETLPVEKP